MKPIRRADKCHHTKRTYANNFTFYNGMFNPKKDKVIDPAGYVLIRVNKKAKKLELAHCDHRHVILKGIRGSTAEEVYSKAIKLGIITQLEYAAYAGAELKKAEYALKHKKSYVQD